MAQFLKFKFLNIKKWNFNGVQFYKKIWNLNYSKNCKFFSYLKFEIENGDYLRWKFWVEKFESKILSEFKLNNGGQFYKNIFYFGYFKKFWILQLNIVCVEHLHWKVKSWKLWVILN